MRHRPYYPVTYAVRGQGAFPLDMLRYDRACPCREQDSRAIENHDSPHPRTVLLIRFFSTDPDASSGNAQEAVNVLFDAWTAQNKRWESFGWKIVPHKQERSE